MKYRHLATAVCVAMAHFACQPNEPQQQQPTAQPPTEKVQHYPTGEVSRRFFLKDGKKEGLMTDYFRDGKVRAERMFQNDQQVGRTVFYHPNGAINEVQYFEAGQKQGGDSIFYEDGKLQMVMEFKNGKKDGYVRKWEPDGSLTLEVRYHLDSLVEVKGKKVTPK